MSLLAAAVLGAGLGVRHAFEADHVAAVCTFVARGGGVSRAVKAGALWGAGHGAIIVVAGGGLVAAGASVPLTLAFALDVAVAAVLVALGVLSIVRRNQPVHEHGGAASGAAEVARPISRLARACGRPLTVGLLHGASGTAALTVLVATTIPARGDALAFIAVFGLASVVAMVVVAAAVAWPLRSAVRRSPPIAARVQGLAGAASIAAGIAIACGAFGVA